eukprot:699630-Pleurochrysis_carterae.AAC.1
MTQRASGGVHYTVLAAFKIQPAAHTNKCPVPCFCERQLEYAAATRTIAITLLSPSLFLSTLALSYLLRRALTKTSTLHIYSTRVASYKLKCIRYALPLHPVSKARPAPTGKACFGNNKSEKLDSLWLRLVQRARLASAALIPTS